LCGSLVEPFQSRSLAGNEPETRNYPLTLNVKISLERLTKPNLYAGYFYLLYAIYSIITHKAYHM
jgi:hypothetical protein